MGIKKVILLATLSLLPPALTDNAAVFAQQQGKLYERVISNESLPNVLKQLEKLFMTGKHQTEVTLDCVKQIRFVQPVLAEQKIILAGSVQRMAASSPGPVIPPLELQYVGMLMLAKMCILYI